MNLRVAAPGLFAVAACLPAPAAPVPAGMAPGLYETLRLGASQALSCSAEDLTYEALARGRHLFTGCGKEAEMLALVVRGPNATSMALPAPSNVYAHDRSCELRTTTMDRLDERTHVVGGCGAAARYRLACECVDCRWELVEAEGDEAEKPAVPRDRKSTRLNSSH